MLRRAINVSLRFRVAVLAVAVGVMVFGLTQLRHAPSDVYPEFAPLSIEVQTEALGLSSAEVEQLITVPLEADLLNGVAWVEDIRSASVPGLSSIRLTFEPGTDLFRARQAVQERLAQAFAIPHVSKPPQMLQPVSSTGRTMLIGLSSATLSPIEISQLARWTIKPRLMGVEGVANVSSFGQRERQLQVQVDPTRLQANEVSLLQVVETAGNALWVSPLSFLEASTPGTGGFIETPSQRLGVRHVSPIESAGDLSKVAVVDKAPLTLGDVATVVEDHQPLIGDALVNNGAGVVLVVEKLRDANTVDVTEGVEAALAALRPGLTDLQIDTSVYRPADYVEASTSNVSKGLIAAVVLAILLLGFAFYQWRLALVAVATILVSLTAAGVVLYLSGQTFNAMTLAGLALALGVVIDDAVAGTDRVARHVRENGTSVMRTVTEATVQVRSALGYAAVFVLLPVLPLFFMGELLGSFGRPLAIAYGLAVLASMVVALMLTPALSVLLLSKPEHAGRESAVVSKLGTRYAELVGRSLGQRLTLVVVGVLALGSTHMVLQMRDAQLPSLNEREFMVALETKPGTSLTRMKEIASDVTGKLREVGGVRNVVSHVGRAVTGDQVVDVNAAKLWVSLDAGADREETVSDIEEIVDGYPDLEGSVQSYQQARIDDAEAGPAAPVVVRVYGNEQGVLTQKANEVGQELAKIDGIEDLQVHVPAAEPTLEVRVDLDKARELGVKPGDVRRAAAILLSGIDVGQLFYDQKVFDVVVWGTPETRENQDDVRGLLIETPSGTPVRLDQVADVRLVDSPDVIEREGVFRRIDVTADVTGRSTSEVAADVERTIANIDFPLEYRAELLGDSASQDARDRRAWLLGAFTVLAMLLVLQASFGSWRLGTVYFLVLPLALVGGVVAETVVEGPTTTGAVLGLLVVLGIAARNGILLVKRYQYLERRGGEVFGPSLVVRGAGERMAPIVMTALATALAFLPFVVLGARPGLEFLHPMAVVVLGGLVTSTAVSLFVLPSLYLAFAGSRTDTELDVARFEEELSHIDSDGDFHTAVGGPVATGPAADSPGETRS